MGIDKWPESQAKQKVSFLLSIIGEEAKKKFFNFELTSEERATPEAALSAIRRKIVPKRNILLDRLDFFNAEQSGHESIDEYCTRLKVMAKVAKLGTFIWKKNVASVMAKIISKKYVEKTSTALKKLKKKPPQMNLLQKMAMNIQ
uniref:Retrotransposon gag domain-containing protein n=1 Tax=Anopheles arabiensis TaxID=7173 RepID=A0A182HGK0_ANOAR